MDECTINTGISDVEVHVMLNNGACISNTWAELIVDGLSIDLWDGPDNDACSTGNVGNATRLDYQVFKDSAGSAFSVSTAISDHSGLSVSGTLNDLDGVKVKSTSEIILRVGSSDNSAEVYYFDVDWSCDESTGNNFYIEKFEAVYLAGLDQSFISPGAWQSTCD